MLAAEHVNIKMANLSEYIKKKFKKVYIYILHLIIVYRTSVLRNYWVGMRHTTIVIGAPCPNLYSRVGVKYPKVTLTAPKYDISLLSPLMW